VIDVAAALGWGLLATALLTLVMSASQGLGWSRISLPYMLGTIFSPRRDRALAIGSGLHAVIGLAVAVGYALVFEGWGEAGIRGWRRATAVPRRRDSSSPRASWR